MSEVKRMPILRFPQFEGKWENIKLGEMLEFQNGINASKNSYGTGIKFINVLDILQNDYITSEKIIGKVEIDEKTLERYSVTYGDIIFQRSSETREEVGTSNVYMDEKPVTFGGFVIRGKKKTDYIPLFLNKLLKTSTIRKEITSNSGGSTRYNVGQETLSKINLLLPCVSEQQKIADFLSSIDEQIQLLKERKKQLETYKKGVMQKIFNQEIRFKDENGEDYPEWKVHKIGDLGIVYSGLSGKSSVDFGKGMPYIQYKQIFDNTIIKTTKCGLVDITENEKQNAAKFGDVFFTISSETPNEVGFSSVLLENVQNVFLNSFCFGFRINDFNKFSPEFARYLFRCQNVRLEIIKLAQGSTRYNMSKNEFLKIKIFLPTFSEQKKIADFLSSIDEKIEACTTRIAKTEEYKKGLLQQMFV